MSSRPKRILFFANTDWYLWNFRLPLAREMRSRGWDVVLVSPSGPWGPRFSDEALRWIPFDFARHGVNPFAELLTLLRLIRLYRREMPDLVHHFTIKCVLYGGIAAKLCRIPVVNALTGLGSVFTSQTPSNRVVAPLVRALYRLVLRGSHVIFQNPDDRDEFGSNRLLGNAAVHLIRSSGVNTFRFRPPDAPPAPQPVVVILVARLLKEKGIEEFVEAARELRRCGIEARFMVVGGEDPAQPSAVDARAITHWKAAGDVAFLGHRDDMLALLQASHIACLPSWREGTPRSVLEAMACGLPIVATDVPGCREVVRNGDNGVLVPVRDPASLAKGLRDLIEDAQLRERMGRRSRERAEQEFSEPRVIAETFAVYRAILS